MTHDLIRAGVSPMAVIQHVSGIVTDEFKIEQTEWLFEKCRKRNVVEARQIIWMFCQTYFGMSANQTAKCFRMDHTTVLHGTEVILQRMADNEKLSERVEALVTRHGLKPFQRPKKEIPIPKPKKLIQLFMPDPEPDIIPYERPKAHYKYAGSSYLSLLEKYA